MSRRRLLTTTDRDRLLVDDVDATISISPEEEEKEAFRKQRRDADRDDDSSFAPAPVPYGTIAFAALLLIVGSVSNIYIAEANEYYAFLFNINVINTQICLATAASIALGVWDASMDDRQMPLLVLGLLLDIPGIYYAIMTMCVLLKVPGWTWARFPKWN